MKSALGCLVVLCCVASARGLTLSKRGMAELPDETSEIAESLKWTKVFCARRESDGGIAWNWLRRPDGSHQTVRGFWGQTRICSKYWVLWFHPAAEDATYNHLNATHADEAVSGLERLCGEAFGTETLWAAQPADGAADEFCPFRVSPVPSAVFTRAAVTARRTVPFLQPIPTFNTYFTLDNLRTSLGCL